MDWVLVVVWLHLGAGSSAATTATFTTEQACEVAQKAVIADDSYAKAWCFSGARGQTRYQ